MTSILVHMIGMGRLFNRKPKKLVEDSSDKVKTALVATAGTLMRPGKSPDETYGQFFNDVQKARVYQDGKTFVDLVPRKRIRELKKAYMLAKQDPTFNLEEFVERHFYEYTPPKHHSPYVPAKHTTAREHVTNLWGELKRRNRKDRGTLFAIPNEYIVPGGRFSEQFYWDSYFIMLGLAADGEWTMIRKMLGNYTYMLRKFGMIPTGNRTYFLSRSQPPFFAAMVKLLARHRGRTRTYAEYLPAMLAEYRFWMKGQKLAGKTPDRRAHSRVVRMPNGVTLNRYYDNKTTPRPEMQYDDIEIAEMSSSHDRDKIFLDLRAAAESGWDFSSRWFHDSSDIESIHTTDIVPVDLNCLLYQLENTIADAYTLLMQPLIAKRYRIAAEKRAATILKYCWDPKTGFFMDYNFITGRRTGRLTLAGLFPMYVKIATSEQAAACTRIVRERFMCEGGLVTTLVSNGQQWDSPNGWAPLQWIAVQALREYGEYGLATEVRDKWLATTEKVFKETRMMVEKYNVVTSTPGGGGEYKLQDGFGWTNGVYAALKDDQQKGAL